VVKSSDVNKATTPKAKATYLKANNTYNHVSTAFIPDN